MIPDSLSLVWDYSVHFAKFPTFKTLLLFLNFHPIHPNFKQGILIMGQYRLLLFFFGGGGTLPKIKKKICHEIFLNSGQYAAGNFSAVSPTIFTAAHPNFMTTLVNLNAC